MFILGFYILFSVKGLEQENLQLRRQLLARDQELASSRAELEKKLAEWKMRDKTGDVTGSTTLGGSQEQPMDTTAGIMNAAGALLAPSPGAGGANGGGVGEQHQDEIPPPSV